MADYREQSTDAAVKLASTAAVAADQSLVVALSPNSPATVADVTASGTLAAAAATVVLSVAGGMSAASAQITGTWVGTIQFEGTVDGTNWVPINGVYAGGTAPGPTISANGVVRITPSGLASIRLNATAWTSGTATITMRTGRGTGGTFLNQSLPIGTNTLGNVNSLDADVLATGTITTTDIVVAAPGGAGVFLSGTSTAGSYVAALAPGGDSAWNAQITGLTSGTLYFEGSLDSSNGVDGQWMNVNGRQTGVVNTVLAGNATANGLYRGNTSGLKYWRIRAVGALTGTPAIVIRLSGGIGAVFLNASIPGGTNSIGTVQQAAITKSTQGTTGVTTQDLKDSGRVNIAMTCYQAAGIITTEALFAASTFSISRDGAAATTGQQLAVTAGKRFSLQSLVVGIKNTAAAAGTSKLVLRYNAAGGAITNTSPILAILDMGSNSVTANAYIGPTEMALPDGVELIASSTFGFTSLCNAVTMLHTITVNGFEY